MDIVIKSFNRPYYLERCLFSIHQYVKNFEGTIFILDDGTPEKYLNKITEKYPKVMLKKSKFYPQKVSDIEKGIQPKSYKIPIDLWSDIVTEVSDYFILIEDDTWFIDAIDVLEIASEMRQNNTQITKLFWLGNEDLKQNKGIQKTTNLELVKPDLFTKNPFLYNLIFRKNYFEIHRRILAKMKIYTFKRHMAYYTIYAVAGTVLNKNFYATLWNNHQNKVEESLQILNALKFYKKNKNSTFANYKSEVLRTGFQSSATNQHKEHYAGNINMFQFNSILNEAWVQDKFDGIEDLPLDISTDKIQEILKNEGSIDPQVWASWVTSFKNQYLSMGCVID